MSNAFPKRPSVFTKDRNTLDIYDRYEGQSAFLICSGPSLNDIDTSLLYGAGIFRMGVNNSPKVVRPHFWTHVDSPDRFLSSIWLDPTIMKFTPWKHRNGQLWNSFEHKELGKKPVNMKQTYFYDWQLGFNPDTWLHQPSFNWGNDEKTEFIFEGQSYKGGRSCMLVAIKLLILMGFNRIYLVGCDFNMNTTKPYAFDQGKGKGSVKGNNKSYIKFNNYYKALRPKLEEAGIKIINANPESGLHAFDKMDYLDAIKQATSQFGDIKNEKTSDMYSSIKIKKKLANKKVQTERRTYEGVFRAQHTPSKTAKRLKAVEVLDAQKGLIRIDKSFASVCKNAEQKKEILLAQGNKAQGGDLEELLEPLLNYFIRKFISNPKQYSRIVNLDYERTILVDNKDERTLKSFL